MYLPTYPPICLPIYLHFYKSIALIEGRRRKKKKIHQIKYGIQKLPQKSSHMERQGGIMLYDLVL
jgi:hypothetical protein